MPNIWNELDGTTDPLTVCTTLKVCPNFAPPPAIVKAVCSGCTKLLIEVAADFPASETEPEAEASVKSGTHCLLRLAAREDADGGGRGGVGEGQPMRDLSIR